MALRVPSNSEKLVYTLIEQFIDFNELKELGHNIISVVYMFIWGNYFELLHEPVYPILVKYF